MMSSLRCSLPALRKCALYARSLATQARPFRVLGVQQIAIGCEQRDPLNALWKNIFGLEPQSTIRIESENVEEDILQLGQKPFAVEVDLMTPIDPEKSPKVKIDTCIQPIMKCGHCMLTFIHLLSALGS